MEDQLVVQEGLILAVGRFLELLYADNGVVGFRDPEWLQGVLDVIISLFRQCVLVANVAKPKAVTFQSGTLRSGMLEEAV